MSENFTDDWSGSKSEKQTYAHEFNYISRLMPGGGLV